MVPEIFSRLQNNIRLFWSQKLKYFAHPRARYARRTIFVMKMKGKHFELNTDLREEYELNIGTKISKIDLKFRSDGRFPIKNMSKDYALGFSKQLVHFLVHWPAWQRMMYWKRKEERTFWWHHFLVHSRRHFVNTAKNIRFSSKHASKYTFTRIRGTTCNVRYGKKIEKTLHIGSNY